MLAQEVYPESFRYFPRTLRIRLIVINFDPVRLGFSVCAGLRVAALDFMSS